MNAFRWIACLLLAVFLSTLVPATVMAEERVDVAAAASSASVEAVEGEEATVVVTISNLGPVPATQVMAEFAKQGASVTISQGVCYEGRHPRGGQCDIGTMAVGQTVTLTYRHRGTGSQVVEFGAWSDDLNDINRRNNYLKVRIAYRNPFDPPIFVRESTSYTPTSRPMLGELQYYRTYTPRRVAITTGRDVELRWDYQTLPYTGSYPQGPEWIPRDIFLIGVQWQLQIWQNAVANSGYNTAQEISALQRMIAQANQYPPGARLPEYLKYQPNCRTISEGCWTDEYRQQVADEQARAAKPPPPIWGNNARPTVSAPPVPPPSNPAKPAAVSVPPIPSTPPKPSATAPPSPTPSPSPDLYEDDDDYNDPSLDNAEEFWTKIDSWLVGLDIALSVDPLPGDELVLTGGIVVKKGADGLLRAWKYNKYLRFLWNGFRITDETFSGFLRLERAVKATKNSKPIFSRGLQWERDMSKTIGLHKLQCIECQSGIRRIDAILKEAVQFFGRTFNKGDALEFKDWPSPDTLKRTLSSEKLLKQLQAYTSALGEGGKIRLIFKQAQNAEDLQKFTQTLRFRGIDHLIDIVNGI